MFGKVTTTISPKKTITVFVLGTNSTARATSVRNYRRASFNDVKDALHGSLPLAFDHQQIVNRACIYVSDQFKINDIATKFVQEAFALSQLRNVYESSWGAELDGAIFLRNLLIEAAPYVIAVGYVSDSTPSGGRPSELFRATQAWKVGGPPIRRRRSHGS